MKKDIEILNELKKIIDMGIIGIEEVVKKVNNPSLEKVMIDEKKEFRVLKDDIMNFLNEYDEKEDSIGIVTRISNDIYTNLKLLKNDDEKEIAKMMIEGTNKAVLRITSLLNNREYKNERLTGILKKTLRTLEHNILDLKKYL